MIKLMLLLSTKIVVTVLRLFATLPIHLCVHSILSWDNNITGDKTWKCYEFRDIKVVAHDTTDHLVSDDFLEAFIVNLLFFVHSFHAEIMVSQATRDGMFVKKVLEFVLEGI